MPRQQVEAEPEVTAPAPESSGPDLASAGKCFLEARAEFEEAERVFHGVLKAKGVTSHKTFSLDGHRFQAARNGRVVEVQDVS